MNESGRSIVDSSVRLGLVALVSVGLLVAVNALTREQIVEQERRAQLRIINEVLPPNEHDNDLLQDMIRVTDPVLLGNALPKRVFRARQDGEPVGVILETTNPRGYNGNIDLIVGIRYDGTLSGVRVLRHKETPGLGDGIDTQVSDWILQFAGLSLDQPPVEAWAVKRDGGAFDQLTGATITPRAVVEAVRKALEYYATHRETLYTRPSE